MFEILIGFVAGVIVTGVVAHNKPEWFTSVVKKAAEVENKVQDQIGDLKKD